MAASIDDILASVTRAHDPNAVFDDSSERQEDLRQLTRAWTSERVCPELLPYPTDLMDRTMQRIRTQIETIEDTTARADAGSSFGLVVMQTELERYRFMVRSMLRTRIAKLDAHTLHYLALHRGEIQSQSQSQAQAFRDTGQPLLSPSEVSYAQTHNALLERLYSSSFLSSFPPKLRRLDDRAGAGGVSMVEGPDLDKAVFVRCLGIRKETNGINGHRYEFDDDGNDNVELGDEDMKNKYEPVEVVCGFQDPNTMESDEDNRIQNRAGQRVVRMGRGEIWVLRWSSVREAVSRGQCELL